MLSSFKKNSLYTIMEMWSTVMTTYTAHTGHCFDAMTIWQAEIQKM